MILTDLDGNFSLSLKNPNGKITISYIGFNPQTLTAASNMQITMKSEDKDVDNTLLTRLIKEAERTQTMGNLQLYSVVVTRSKELKTK